MNRLYGLEFVSNHTRLYNQVLFLITLLTMDHVPTQFSLSKDVPFHVAVILRRLSV